MLIQWWLLSHWRGRATFVVVCLCVCVCVCVCACACVGRVGILNEIHWLWFGLGACVCFLRLGEGGKVTLGCKVKVAECFACMQFCYAKRQAWVLGRS